MRTKIIGVCLMALFSWLLSGCTSKTATLNIVVFNYTDTNIYDISIGESYVQGHYWKKSGGGGVVSGVPVPLGEATLYWTYSNAPEDTRPKSFFERKASVVVPKPAKGDRFLGVHIYPDDTVEFSLSKDIPGKKKQGEPYDNDWYTRKDPFYSRWE